MGSASQPIGQRHTDRRPRRGHRWGAGRQRAGALLLPLALAAGCAGPDTRPAAAPPTAQPATAGDEASAPSPPVIERPIPAESVYPLLVAEFALRRRDFDTALRTYLQQAEVLGDPAISRHATHLAQYLQREDTALEAVTQWLEVEPDSVEANATRATLLARRGRSREALGHLAVVARSGQAARFPIILNRFKALPAGAQAALDGDVQALLDDDLGDSVSLRLTHALLAETAGRREEALARLQRVFELEPYQLQALLLEARLLLTLDRERPLARIESALEAQPGRSELRLQYARLLARRDVPAAREQFERLAEESPEDPKLLFSLALLNHELEDLGAARGYLQQVLEVDADNDPAWLFLGRIAASEGDTETALQHFRQVGEGEEFVDATVSIGKLLLAETRDEEFGDYMVRLRQSYPRRREQLYGLEANLLTEAQRDRRGLQLLDEAISAFPESDNLYYARSILLERSGDIAAAERDLRRIIARDPDNATALNALGYTLANRTERHAEAQALIERALALQPNEPAILDSMGWVLYRRGRYERALEYLSRAYASFPDPEVAAHLGEVLWITGDTGGARDVWRGAYERDPEHRVLNATLERLGVSLDPDAGP